MADVGETSVQVDSLALELEKFELRIDNWSVRRGDCAAFVGRNGSGKTTVLESILGLRKDAQLRGSLLGYRFTEWKQRAALRQRLGVLLQRAGLPEGLYVKDIIALHRNLYHRSSAAILDALGVGGLANQAYERISRGEQQRVDLFMSLAHEPELLILDEPFTGLDSRFAHVTAGILKGLSNTTILMACHSELELSRADNMVWLDAGKIRDSGHPQALRTKMLGDYRLHVSFRTGACALDFITALRQQFKQTYVRAEGETEVIVAGDKSIVSAAQSLVGEGYITALQYGPTSLADLLNCCARGESALDSLLDQERGTVKPAAGVQYA